MIKRDRKDEHCALPELLREGKFWFLKESTLELWLINKKPKVLPYLAIAYYCVDDTHVGYH